MNLASVDPRSLRRNPWNSNRVDPKNLTKLRKSIEDLGFNSAVVVRELPSGELQILGGQHRTEVAIDLGLKTIPVLNLGVISDVKAKKIGLVDNSRYGTDDSLQLAQIIEDLGVDADLTSFLPMQEEDLQAIMRAVDIDLDTLDVHPEDEEDEPYTPADERPERPAKTHDVIKFRLSVRDAEAIRTLIEKTLKREKGLDEGDEMTAAGNALAFLLLHSSHS